MTMEKVPMTLDGHAKMMDEIKHLKTVERPVIRLLEEARAMATSPRTPIPCRQGAAGFDLGPRQRA